MEQVPNSFHVSAAVPTSPTVAIIASHVEHALRLEFLCAAVDSLLALQPPVPPSASLFDLTETMPIKKDGNPFVLAGIVISLSHGPSAGATEAVERVAAILRNRSPLVLAVLQQPQPLRQFQHIAAAVQWLQQRQEAIGEPLPSHALLLDDDDLFHPELLRAYSAAFGAGGVGDDTVVTCHRLTSKSDIETQRRAELDFEGMSAAVGKAAVRGAFVDFSGSLVSWPTLQKFVVERADVLDSRYADGFFRLVMTTQLHCERELVWQRRWRRPMEFAAWQEADVQVVVAQQ
jgi:hypothetical protein